VNPTTVTIENLKSLAFTIGLNRTPIVTIKLSGIALSNGFNKFSPVVSLTFNQAREAAGAIAATVKSFMNAAPVEVDVMGPIDFEQIPKVAQVTQNMTLKVPMPSNANMDGLVQNITNSLVDALNRTRASVTIGSTSIDASIKLNLPRLLALPSVISFPYKTIVSIFAGSQDVIDAVTDPVTINTDLNSITSNLMIRIIPKNSTDAANALAASINPLLSSNPQVIIILLKHTKTVIKFFYSKGFIRGFYCWNN
jgi:hypothetical protein